MFTNKEIFNANNAYNNTEKVFVDTDVYIYFSRNYKPNTLLTVLDFGSGLFPSEALKLQSKGYNVTLHEFGNNFLPDVHSKVALDYKYDIILASNVINVQSSSNMLKLTLSLMADSLKAGGSIILNYPPYPNLLKLSKEELEKIFSKFFSFKQIKKYNNLYKLQLLNSK